jgi:hypothetical protein
MLEDLEHLQTDPLAEAAEAAEELHLQEFLQQEFQEVLAAQVVAAEAAVALQAVEELVEQVDQEQFLFTIKIGGEK